MLVNKMILKANSFCDTFHVIIEANRGTPNGEFGNTLYCSYFVVNYC